MEYKKIENLVYKNNLIKRENYKTKKEYDLKLDSMLIENLNRCIEKKIPLSMTEEDVTKIYKIYLKVNKTSHSVGIDFIKNLIDLSEKKLDFFEIVNNITE